MSPPVCGMFAGARRAGVELGEDTLDEDECELCGGARYEHLGEAFGYVQPCPGGRTRSAIGAAMCGGTVTLTSAALDAQLASAGLRRGVRDWNVPAGPGDVGGFAAVAPCTCGLQAQFAVTCVVPL